MKKFIITGAIALLFLGGVAVTPTQTHAATVAEQIEALLAQLVDLQNQLATLKGEIRDVIKDGLAEGMTDEDIAKVQELLATDSDIYPQGLVTGYFGPLTKEALKRFQVRHELAPTGVIDEDTQDLLEEYLSQGFGDKIPPGLLRAPGIAKKVRDRLCADDSSHKGSGPLCKMYQGGDDDDEDDDSDDDSNDDDDDSNDDDDDSSDDDSDDAFDVEVEIEDGMTDLEFTFDGTDYTVNNIDSTDLDDVLDEAADAINDGDTAEDLDEDLADAIEAAFDDEVSDNEDEAEAEAMDDAQQALDDAQDAIDDAQAEIDVATGDTEDAEAKLLEAETKLGEAQDEFDADNYEDAETLAGDAEDLADEAKTLAEAAA